MVRENPPGRWLLPCGPMLDRFADPNQNVVLTGFMGTGKSTAGRRLARRLGFDFVDTDDLIESAHGPIADLFAARGEAGFRRLERESVAGLARRQRLVIATGGGTLLDRATERLVGGSGRVLCLAASPEVILDRVIHSRSGVTRPLLDHPDPAARVRDLLATRWPVYRRFPQVSSAVADSDALAAELETIARTRPALHRDGGRPIVVGIGIAARAAAMLTGTDATVVDVGRIQPHRPLTARALVEIQTDLAARLVPT